jgi:hypothetical protein
MRMVHRTSQRMVTGPVAGTEMRRLFRIRHSRLLDRLPPRFLRFPDQISFMGIVPGPSTSRRHRYAPPDPAKAALVDRFYLAVKLEHPASAIVSSLAGLEDPRRLVGSGAVANKQSH